MVILPALNPSSDKTNFHSSFFILHFKIQQDNEKDRYYSAR